MAVRSSASGFSGLPRPRVAPLARPYFPRRRTQPAQPPAARSLVSEANTCGPVSQLLDDILRSACEVAGADQAFFLVTRDEAALEAVATYRMRPGEVMDVVLCRAAHPVHLALRERRLAAADADGRALPVYDGNFELNAPAVLCVPLDLGLKQSGALCMMRKRGARRLSELDLEIVQALSGQAELAIGAERCRSALSRLEASLKVLSPAHA